MLSAIVLAGGPSSRLGGRPKALVELCGRPMLSYVLDTASSVADEVLVVVGSEGQGEALSNALGDAELVVDEGALGPPCPLRGLVSGLRAARGGVALVLACDMPLVSARVLSFLADVLSHMNAAIPRWPNGYVEPLQAVYRAGPSIRAGEALLKAGEDLSMRSFLRALGRVRYVSTEVLKELDPDLATFLNVNSPADLRKAEMALRARERRAQRGLR